MKFPALLCSDLHLTANPRDEYRWGLFPWLLEQAARYSVSSIGILGDLTDAKDYHSAELVNRTAQNVTMLARVYTTYVLKGNHDYLRDGHAFFEFLSLIPNLLFINQPYDSSAVGEACLWLPHTKSPAKDWAGIDLSHCQYVFMHQTIKGALASNGQAMEGEPLPDLSAAGKVYSGDIHVPQVIGPVEYVGSPYHVHFGDSFRPRCLVLFEDGTREVLRFPSVSRVSLKVASVEEFKAVRSLRACDQVKLEVSLAKSDLPFWRSIRQELINHAESLGVVLEGVKLTTTGTERGRVRVAPRNLEPGDVMAAYVSNEGLGGEFLQVGLDFINTHGLHR